MLTEPQFERPDKLSAEQVKSLIHALDLVVSSVLTSMGMVMMPPVVISAPFKVLLFVIADGWHLVARSLSLSFG